jgi:hypothetical protein
MVVVVVKVVIRRLTMEQVEVVGMAVLVSRAQAAAVATRVLRVATEAMERVRTTTIRAAEAEAPGQVPALPAMAACTAAEAEAPTEAFLLWAVKVSSLFLTRRSLVSEERAMLQLAPGVSAKHSRFPAKTIT